ncbi:LysR family transcriptional regulator [Burkholderia stabilis]|uniref:LysR family transcriptional regulator n=2 Tax=Burkholderia stabilis TaxID=95485 RepID=A0A4Q2A6P4_9BURK|nr:LysR family transcriptional regulator [Burkholderia stabilis]
MQLDSSILGWLRCFESAGRLLSFTKAAQALNLTQSAVSQQIRHLEERLGYPLFERHSRGLVMTSKGKALWEVTSKAFLEINQTLGRLGLSHQPLQVSCSPSFALQWLIPRLTIFQRQQPDVPLRVIAEFQSLDRYAMEAGGIDVAIRYDPLEYPNLHAETIMDEHLVAVATPTYLKQHPAFATGVSPDGVVLLHDAAAWDGAPEFVESRVWMEAIHPSWIGHLAGPQYNLSSLAISAAMNHQGVAITRSALVYEELQSGRLVNVFGRHVPAPARYVLIFRQPEDQRIATFSAWLKGECEQFDNMRRQLFLA